MTNEHDLYGTEDGEEVHDTISDAIDHLDEDLSDPEGGATPKSPAMLALAQKFAEDLCALYVPWACEPTGNAVWVNMDGEIVKEPK